MHRRSVEPIAILATFLVSRQVRGMPRKRETKSCPPQHCRGCAAAHFLGEGWWCNAYWDWIRNVLGRCKQDDRAADEAEAERLKRDAWWRALVAKNRKKGR